MKKKKVIALILTLILCISLSACGGTEEKSKGTLENPYQIGEEVVIEDVYAYPNFDDPWNEVPFTLTIKVKDVMSKEEMEAEREKNEHSRLDVVRYTIKIDGDYSGPIAAQSNSGITNGGLMTESMVELDEYSILSMYEEANDTFLSNVFVGTEYEVIEFIADRDPIPEPGLKYFYIKYFNKEGVEQRVYVDLTVGNEEPEEEASEDEASKEEAEVESEEASTYEIAIAAKEARYYGYALRLFKSIPTYKDAEQQIEELQGVLDEYNAEYTVTAFGGGTYSMKIKDGIATLAFDIDNPSIHYFELFEYVYEDGSTKIHMGNVHDYDGDGVMDDNGYITDGGDIYTLTPTNNGGVMVMAFEGNTNTYWNGSTN